ncbi:MAG: hypothetical protein R2729_27355 [Bryobacteraceae bacterium]
MLFEQVLHVVAMAAMAGLLIRIRTLGLSAVYPWFTAMIAASLAVSLGSQAIGRLTSLYAYYYFASTAVLWVLQFLVIRELYRNVLLDHTGLAAFGKWLVYGGGAIALAVAALMAWPEVRAAETPLFQIPQSRLIRSFFVIQRTVASALAFLIAIISVFLAWFPIRVRRNTLLIWAGVATLLLSQAILLLVRNLGGSAWTLALSTGYQCLETACFLLWWRKFGAREALPSAQLRTGGDEARLSEQLNEINEALLRLHKF